MLKKLCTRRLFPFSIICLFLFFSCGKDDEKNPTGPSNDTAAYPCEDVKISLSIPPGSELDVNDLRVISFSDEVSFGTKDAVMVSMPKTDKSQLVFIAFPESGVPVFLGVRHPSVYSVGIGSNSTALALSLLNPFLIGSDKTVQDAYISAVLLNPKFDELLALLESAYKENTASALDYDSKPSIYRLSLDLMVDVCGSIGMGVSETGKTCPEPYIEDRDGDAITLGNPTLIWYGAGVYPDNNSLEEVVTIPCLERNSPLSPSDTVVNLALGNGYFRIHLARGFDYSLSTDWNDPVGRATVLNTAQAIIHLVETGTGEIPYFNETMAKRLPGMMAVSPSDISSIGGSLEDKNVWGLYNSFLGVLAKNKEEIRLWLWNGDGESFGEGIPAGRFIDCLTDMLQRFGVLYESAGWSGDQVPFFRDIIDAPEETMFYITQEAGEITSRERKYDIFGRILEDGSGLAGVTIRVSVADADTTITSLPDGCFTLGRLEPGTYTFLITKDGYRFSYSIFSIQIDDSDVVVPDITAIRSGDTNGQDGSREIHGITFVAISGGTFQMGDVENVGESDEKPVHFVTLDGFEMSACEITVAQYIAYLNEALASDDITVRDSWVIGTSGEYAGMRYSDIGKLDLSGTESGIGDSGDDFGFNTKVMNHPVTHVTWFGAKAFASYYGFDLPTEAEWEYAARGGRQHKYGTNDGTLTMDNAAINLTLYNINIPKDVGSFPPNPFGLHDMCCGVMEWCDDGYDSGFYSHSSSTNPRGTGSFKVVRDGRSPDDCRAAARDHMKISEGHEWVGFRVVRRQ